MNKKKWICKKKSNLFLCKRKNKIFVKKYHICFVNKKKNWICKENHICFYVKETSLKKKDFLKEDPHSWDKFIIHASYIKKKDKTST